MAAKRTTTEKKEPGDKSRRARASKVKHGGPRMPSKLS